MAYNSKSGTLIVNEWTKGMTSNPLTGNESLINADLTAYQGGLGISKKLTNDLDVAGSVDKIYKDYSCYNTNLYWQNALSINLGSGNYIRDFLVDDNKIYNLTANNLIVYATSYSTPGIDTSQYATFVLSGSQSSGAVIYSNVKAQVIFFDNNVIKKIDALDLTAHTSTVSTLITLPAGLSIIGMEEINNNLVIFANKNNKGYIYTWDYQTFDTSGNAVISQTLSVGDQPLNAFTKSDNLIYFSAGSSGNIYVSNGVSFNLFLQIPYIKQVGQTVSSSNSFACLVYQRAMTINQAGKLLIGTGGYLSNFSGANIVGGVWEIDIPTKNIYLKYAYPSYSIKFSPTYTFGNCVIYSIYTDINANDPDNLQIGYYGVFDNKFGKASLGGVNDFFKYITPMYIVGELDSKKTFTKGEICLGYPLSSYSINGGLTQTYQKIKIYARAGAEFYYEIDGVPPGYIGSWRLIAETNYNDCQRYNIPFKANLADLTSFQLLVIIEQQVDAGTAVNYSFSPVINYIKFT